jgi:fatty acid desaturase
MPDGSRPTVEWPTMVVAAGIYAGYGALTLYYHSLPWWLVLPAGGFLLAWHGSLQHEVVHGHPTRWRWLNRALVFPSLWLWLPFEVYADTHLRHHRDESITDPLADPESYYLSEQDWTRAGPLRRALLRFHNTAVGRLLLGPLVSMVRLLTVELKAFAKGDFAHLNAWVLHGLGCALVILWVSVVCQIPLLWYLLLFVYPGISITLLRSFAEHQARANVDERLAIVESGPIMSLLYLNNNLHYLHHREPRLAWYRLPALWRTQRAAVLRANGNYRFNGYADVIRRYAFKAREPVAWPL